LDRILDRRVVALVQVASAVVMQYVLDLMKRYMAPETASWHLDNEGRWTRHHLGDDGRPLEDVQSFLLASRPRQRSLSRR
jgi:polyphosphate kinase